MAFAISGGIEWEKDTTNKVLTIRPTATPESGYTSGQMKDYQLSEVPWGQITDYGWNLVIENGVTQIGIRSFKNSTGFIGSLTIPGSVVHIFNNAFEGCTGFNALVIENGVQIIYGDAFSGCTGFTGSLTIPSSVRSIDNSVFKGCTGFTGSLTIPDTVTSLGSYVFQGCTGFGGNLIIGNGVTSLGYNTFDGCTGFTGELRIGKNVTKIYERAFQNCSGFASVNFMGNQPSTIGYYAFYLNQSSPAKTYTVYSNGWATSTTFKSFTYTKWIYKKHPQTFGKVNGTWVKGKPFVKVGGHWKEVTASYSKIGGSWKKSV